MKKGPQRRPPGLSRRAFLGTAALGAGFALLEACQAPTPAAPASPPRPATGPATTPPQAAAPAEWERDWNNLIEGARKEGRVMVNGPPIPEARTTIPARFAERFGVEVQYVGGSDSDHLTRLENERAAGQYTVDITFVGPVFPATKYYPEKWLDPIRPALIHPEVTDPAKWIPGKLWFSDPEERYVLRLLNSVNAIVAVNTDQVNPDDLKTAQGLLDPKFRGLLAGENPTLPGGGANVAAYLYVKLGEDFVQRLYLDQDLRLSQDRRQLGDGLARGTQPIVVGMSNADAEYATLIQDGFPIKVLEGFTDAPGYVGAGSGLVCMLSHAPHPNAAKLFVNWLASKEGIELYARAERKAGLRTDIDQSWAPSYTVPKPGVEYFDTYDWIYARDQRPEVIAKITALLRR